MECEALGVDEITRIKNISVSREVLRRLRSSAEAEGEDLAKDKWMAERVSQCLVHEAPPFLSELLMGPVYIGTTFGE